MLEVEHKYETPTESKIYQNEMISSNPQEPDKSQGTTSYTPYMIEANSNMDKIYQKTTTKMSSPKEKIWTTPLFLEKTDKQKPPITRSEIDFLTNSGTKLNIIIIFTWNETLHPIFPFQNCV